VEEEISNKERLGVRLFTAAATQMWRAAAVARTRSHIKYIEREPRGRVNKKLDRSWEERELVERWGVTG
jgi:hypothetical protein